MTPLNKSYKYVNPNLKLFHKLHRNGQTKFKYAVSFSSEKGDDETANGGVEAMNKKEESEKSSHEKKEYPEAPTTCCMSGCANCVWLDYAEKLSEYYKDGGEQAVKEINEKVTDENVKAFLLHELRMRNIK